MKKLFVGNLTWKATEETLKPLFEAYGAVVSIKIIADPVTGKSRGFGFVEMESAEAATAAIDGLNDKPLLDRNMRIPFWLNLATIATIAAIAATVLNAKIAATTAMIIAASVVHSVPTTKDNSSRMKET